MSFKVSYTILEKPLTLPASLHVMRSRTPLNSRIYSPAAIPATQGGRIHPTHARALATRTTTDKLETPRPKLKLGLDREMPYIEGEFTVIGLT